MGEHLVLTIRLHDARYHGASEWPPAPARVFQALLSGAAQGNRIPEATQRALSWLERQPAPLIAAPYARRGQVFSNFVPNNDADSLGGDLGRIGEIRSQKETAPQLLASDAPFLYVWPIADAQGPTNELTETAEALYQFGRGIDMAWAAAEVVDEDKLQSLLSTYRGTVHYPTQAESDTNLACPAPGSLKSLAARHTATTKRIRSEGTGRSATTLFVQPPKPRFVQVSYDSPRPYRIFTLNETENDAKFYPWSTREVLPLVERLRDIAAHKLREAVPSLATAIEQRLIGRAVDGVHTPSEQRVRIVPLPSIGMEHTDRAIRRILVEVQDSAELPARDVFWAFAGQSFDTETGETGPFVLTPSSDEKMLGHYALPARRFRSVTPAVLPQSAQRRRIDPSRQREEAKGAQERLDEERRAVHAVRTALRHAGIREQPVAVYVQREPLETKGTRAELFAPSSRFEKERLWHVELEFAEPIAFDSPLTLGDGRFLGLGVMAPVREAEGVFAFAVDDGLKAHVDAVELARALRRAVMSRVQAQIGRAQLSVFFSGHEPDGEATRSPHLTFQYDPRGRLLVIAPHVIERREPSAHETKHISLLKAALDDFCELRAGRAGLLRLEAIPTWAEDDAVFGTSQRWTSLTPYTVQRHPKGKQQPSEAIAEEVRAECSKSGLPRPEVEVTRVSGVAGRGLQAMVHLTFSRYVQGPLVLGKTRHLGGGLMLGRPTHQES